MVLLLEHGVDEHDSQEAADEGGYQPREPAGERDVEDPRYCWRATMEKLPHRTNP